MRSSEVDEACANCGKVEVDNIKLKKCACNLVKYCSVECQKNHRSQHKKACKKQLAEIREDKLFRQPDESHHGECPICCLPLPLDERKTTINTCCCQLICNGCSHANDCREREQGKWPTCPFCREPMPKSEEETDKILMKRVKANDPNALILVGSRCNVEGDYDRAVEYFTKAAELGDVEAHYQLSYLYREGQGVEKDLKRQLHHLEVAAIGGHPSARHYLGFIEGENGRYERAYKHYIIAAKLGYDDALEVVKQNFRRGYVNKDDFEAALRGHQAAVDATKSEQRDAAEEFFKQLNQI